MKQYTFPRLALSIATLSVCIVVVLAGLMTDDLPVSAGETAASHTASVLEKISPRLLQDTANGKSASFIILMSEQADLSAAYAMKDHDARGLYVYNTLRQHAARTQAGLRYTLDEQDISYKSFWAANSIVATGNRSLIEAIAARDDVRAIEANRPFNGLGGSSHVGSPAVENLPIKSTGYPAIIEWGVQNVRAPQVWNLGYTGGGDRHRHPGHRYALDP